MTTGPFLHSNICMHYWDTKWAPWHKPVCGLAQNTQLISHRALMKCLQKAQSEGTYSTPRTETEGPALILPTRIGFGRSQTRLHSHKSQSKPVYTNVIPTMFSLLHPHVQAWHVRTQAARHLGDNKTPSLYSSFHGVSSHQTFPRDTFSKKKQER